MPLPVFIINSKTANVIQLFFYNLGILLYGLAVRIASLFKPKARLFLKGRKDIFSLIESKLKADPRKKIWVHCASLGEFEQGRPVIEQLKESYPDTSIVLTFFSPSGYEVKKNYEHADHIFYLPLDTRKNATRFLDLVKPGLALFVKYEFWYHYLETLHHRQIPAVLFSAIFQPRHPFFKWYGGLYRKMLSFYRQIFVQDESSRALLEKIQVGQVQIAGDTRFDRAAKILELDKSFQTIDVFKQGHKLILAGSTWPGDEVLLKEALAKLPETYKLLIAPHEVGNQHIAQIEAMFPGDCCIWAVDEPTLRQKRVCIVHTVGQLAYLYKYADLVWVGGGFTKSGIHSIIEPAVFGVPIFFGPNYERYREAVDMIGYDAAKSVTNADELIKGIENENALLHMGNNAKQYVNLQLGATRKIMTYLSEKCLDSIA